MELVKGHEAWIKAEATELYGNRLQGQSTLSSKPQISQLGGRSGKNPDECWALIRVLAKADL